MKVVRCEQGDIVLHTETTQEQEILAKFQAQERGGRCKLEFALWFNGRELDGPQTLRITHPMTND